MVANYAYLSEISWNGARVSNICMQRICSSRYHIARLIFGTAIMHSICLMRSFCIYCEVILLLDYMRFRFWRTLHIYSCTRIHVIKRRRNDLPTHVYQMTFILLYTLTV